MRFVVVLLLLGIFAGDSYAQWQKIFDVSNIPYSRNQTILYKDGTIFVVNLNGLIVSRDDGQTWDTTRTPPKTVDSLGNTLLTETFIDVDFFDRNNGLLTTTKHVYRTRDAGITWDSILSQGNVSWSAKFIKSSEEIAVSVDRLVYAKITRNGGASWDSTAFPGYMQTMDLRTRPNGEVAILLIDSGSTGTHIATTQDYGVTWKFTPQGIDYDCFSMHYDYCDTNTMYVINEEALIASDLKAMLYITNDKGASWRKCNPTTNLKYYTGAMSVSPGSVIFLQTVDSGIIRSVDDGKTWDNIGGPGGVPDARLVHAVTDNIIYASDRYGNIFKTTNSGGSSAINPKMKLTFDKSILFDRTKVSLCDSLFDTVRFRGPSCPMLGITSIAALGEDYSILRNDGDTMIIVRFAPTKSGARSGSLRFTLDNDRLQSVMLFGIGADTGYMMKPTTDTLFLRDSVSRCSTLTRSFRIHTSGCVFPTVINDAIIGAASADYSIISKRLSTLTGDDSVTIVFAPRNTGARSATYTLRLADNRTVVVQLRGVGLDNQSYYADPDRLFEMDTVLTCKSITRDFLIKGNACMTNKVANQTITGGASSDYKINMPPPDTLTGNDRVSITFLPSTTGLRDAVYTLTLVDSTKIIVSLLGYGERDDGRKQLIAVPSSLFDGDSIPLCSSITRGFRIKKIGCFKYISSQGQKIVSSSGEYTIIIGAPDTLTGNDSVTITFTPKTAGLRYDEYFLSHLSKNVFLTVPLRGVGIETGNSISASPTTLFTGDSVRMCGRLGHSFVVNSSGCNLPTVVNERILGTSVDEYKIESKPLTTLTGSDTVRVLFLPSAKGWRDAVYILKLSNGKELLVPLEGVGINGPYTMSAEPNTLFQNDTLHLCDTLVRDLVLVRNGCAELRFISVTITGPAAGDYGIMGGPPGVVWPRGTLRFRFIPKDIGLRDAVFRFRLDDGTEMSIPLLGNGRASQPIALSTIPAFTTDTIGDDIKIPIIISGLTQPETVELDIHFEKNLVYHGTTSLSSKVPLDLAGTTTASSSRIRIPASEIRLDTVCAVAYFSIFADSGVTSVVSFDGLSVIDAALPCAYTTDTKASTTITGPSGCGITTLSDFMRYGKMPTFRIYPNPTTGEITVVSTQPLGSIEVCNAMGMAVERVCNPFTEGMFGLQTRTTTIDLSLLPSGLYFVRVSGHGAAVPVVVSK